MSIPQQSRQDSELLELSVGDLSSSVGYSFAAYRINGVYSLPIEGPESSTGSGRRPSGQIGRSCTHTLEPARAIEYPLVSPHGTSEEDNQNGQTRYDRST